MSHTDIDWSRLPEPQDDGGADHLTGAALPATQLSSTAGNSVAVSELSGTSVIFIYPRTGGPDGTLPEGWDDIPGARGCTPQACRFKDRYDALRHAGAGRIFGLSTQDTTYQSEAATRLELPYPLLSDHELAFGNALNLPHFTANGARLYKRMTLIIRAGKIAKVFYPVFPPDENADKVLAWLEENPA